MSDDEHTAPRIREYKTRFWPLLAIALVTLIAPSLFGARGSILLLMINYLLWISGVFAVSRSRRALVVSIALGAITMICQSAVAVNGAESQALIVAYHMASIAFIMLIVVYLFTIILSTSTVTTDTLLGGISLYLIIGIFFAAMYSLTEVMQPGSFSIPDNPDGTDPMVWLPGRERSSSLYFSFTTLTTLGYGDITPTSPPAKTLTSVEAIIGQLYVAILIARLVSDVRRRPDAEQG